MEAIIHQTGLRPEPPSAELDPGCFHNLGQLGAGWANNPDGSLTEKYYDENGNLPP